MAELQSPHQPADQTLWRFVIAQVMHDVRMVEIELAGTVEAVAFLRYRDGDKRGVGSDETAAYERCIRRGNEHLADRANHARGGCRVELHQCVETILRRQRIPHRRCLEGDRADGSAFVALQESIEVERLVSSMESSRPEVHGADACARSIILGPQHLGRHARERAFRKARGQRVTPVFQMASSRSPLRSAQVGRPEAVAMTRSSSAWARSSMLAPASNGPASKSIQRGLACASAVLLEIFRVGAGKPSGVPRPVVKSSTVAPAAAIAVLEIASLPGDSSRAKPGRRIRSPYLNTWVSGASPAFCTAPRDFSSRVVIPPAWLPGEGFSDTGCPAAVK